MDFERVAILGTGQTAASDAELTATAVDPLVAQLASDDRERAFLLRAGGLALLERAARPASRGVRRPEPANDETLRPSGEKLAEILAGLFDATREALLVDTLEQMTKARMRLPEELLPAALSLRDPSLRSKILPVLGERGTWLARMRADWAWARSGGMTTDMLPTDVRSRWEDAGAAERRLLLQNVRDIDPDLARSLAESSWKQEKADQRLRWLEVFETNLSRNDEEFLGAATSDRSALVRVAAARLLWQLPESELARRARARVESLVSVGTQTPFALAIELPPETFDPMWERDGIVEAAPQGVGRRQWWLAQMLSAVHPDHWCSRFGVRATDIVTAAAAHDLDETILDGLTTAALRHRADGWYAALYDAAERPQKPRLTNDPAAALAPRLAPAEAQPRMLATLHGGRLDLLPLFSRPWPHGFAKTFVAALSAYRAGWGFLLPVAALAIPVDLLPSSLPIPDVPDNDHATNAWLRSFDEFLSIANTRQIIAKEVAP